MGIVQRKISVADLEKGMFVSGLDRPWHETPFPIQGFPVMSESHREQLAHYCKYVFVDIEEENKAPIPKEATSANQRASDDDKSDAKSNQDRLQLPPIKVNKPEDYAVTTPMNKEVSVCEQVVSSLYSELTEMYQDKQMTQETIEQLSKASRDLTNSVIRNPNALLWLSRLEFHDDRTFRHSLRMTSWALTVGRHMGLSGSMLTHLSTGSLLCQIGKMSLPKSLLDQEGQLCGEDQARFEGYVNESVRMLKWDKITGHAMGVVAHHQERHNGAGFPNQVPGDKIPLLARITGIAYYFEYLISSRPGHQELTPTAAIQKLYALRNIDFHQDLVEAFIQAVGIYPVGSRVQLSDGSVGVILSHTPDSRLRPKVVLIKDGSNNRLPKSQIVDLNARDAYGDLISGLTIKACLTDSDLPLKRLKKSA